MPLPSLFLGIILSTLYGVAFHFWRGGKAGRLMLYIILSWAGFWIGHFLSTYLNWDFGQLGRLHLGFATIISVIFLLVGHWLSQVKVSENYF